MRNQQCPNFFARQNSASHARDCPSDDEVLVTNNNQCHNVCQVPQRNILGSGAVINKTQATSRRALSEPPISYEDIQISSEIVPPEEPAVQELMDDDSGSSEPLPSSPQGEISENENDVSLNFLQVSGPTNRKKYLRGCFTEQTFSMYQLQGPDHISVLDFVSQLDSVLARLLQEVFIDAQPDDGVMVLIHCVQNMNHPITIPLTRFRNFRVSHIISALEAAKMSGSIEFKISDGIQLTFKHIKQPPSSAFNPIRGGSKGNKRYIFANREQSILDRKCIVRIVNPNDEMCLARSIIVAKAHNDLRCAKRKSALLTATPQDHKNKDDAEVNFARIRRHERCLQTLKATECCDRIQITPQTKCGLEEVQKFEDSEKIYIKIVGADIFDQIAYSGVKLNFREDLPVTNENVVYILRYFVTNSHGQQEFHYCPIIDISTYFGKVFYCHYCDYGYNEPHGHKCDDVEKWCYSCYRRTCQEIQNTNSNHQNEKCNICQVLFLSAQCREAHRRMECYKAYYCIQCRKAVKRPRKKQRDGSFKYKTDDECRSEHVCVKDCPVCKEEIIAGSFHQCFIQQRSFKEPSEKLIFLDFETTQTSGEHIPVYCHLKYFDTTLKTWVDKKFELNKEIPNIKNEVGKFIFHERFIGYSVLAHNMRAFDGCFLLQYLAEIGLKPIPIFSGQQITSLTIPTLQIRIIDSLNFLKMPLQQFPKTFGFESDAKKGYFPHFFTMPENFDYVGSIPLPEAYGVKTMSCKGRKEFMIWYNEKKNDPNYTFNFKEEMAMYCAEDVEILKRGCLAFKDQIMQISQNKCDPFNYVTLAAITAAIFRGMFLQPEKIAAVPPNGYSTHQRYSSKSLEWLEYLRQIEGCQDLKHIGNSPYGECEIAQYRFDGVETNKKVVYEFNGCYYHGCPKCNKYKMDKKNSTIGLTFRALHEKTLQKESFIKDVLKWDIVSMWECEWEKIKTENEEISDFVKQNQHLFTPFSPFEAFHGGRVETFKMCVDDGETKLNYVDFTSLYPYINATKRYPVGHPVIILNDFGSFDDICDRYFGLMKCSILPPRNLYVPVLPGKYGSDNKLIFTLCHTCANLRTSKRCKHTDEQRTITGTWFTEEIKLALEMGYQLKSVHGIHHFENTSTELFSDFIKLFYGLKIHASGRPSHCKNDEDLKKFIQEVKEKEGVDLDFDKFSLNPPMRQIAKLLINSLWGRFGLRRNLPCHKFVSSAEEIFEIMDDPANQVTNILPLHENMVLVTFKKSCADFLELNNDANIYIASITTAYGRIELYNKMKLLMERLAYVDTDGLMFIHKKDADLETGPFLGELTNELKEGDFIRRFMSGGPKNYAFETEMGDRSIKVKGFTLTSTNAESFTLENMKKILLTQFQKEPQFSQDDCDEEFDFVYNNQPKRTVQVLPQRERTKQNERWRSEAFSNFHASTADSASSGATENYISTFNPTKIVRDKYWNLLSKSEQKLYTIMYDKRVVLNDFDTLPYGF